MWCNEESEHLVLLYEIHGNRVSEPSLICRRHLIPGDDPCPFKQYELREDGNQICRVWREGDALKESINQRYEWFKSHPNAVPKKDMGWWLGKDLPSKFLSTGNKPSQQRSTWFEDHPTELTR